MFCTARSQIGSARSGAIGGGSYSLFDSAVVDCQLACCHSVDFSVVALVVPDINFIVFPISALHHVVIVDCGYVFGATTETFGRENFLPGSDDVESFFWFVDFAFDHFDKARGGYIAKALHYNSIRTLLRIISRFSIFMLKELN